MIINHFNVSMAKSIIRIVGFTALACQWFILAGILLIIAEGLGVVEEMVEYD